MSLIPSGFAKNAAAAAGFYDHPIEQSLRFNDDDSAYLSWTPASAGNRKTWTWSGWVKRGNLTGTRQAVFVADISGVVYWGLEFDASNKLNVYDSQGLGQATTAAVYRDVSAWYHIVVVSDTTNATAADRFQLYVNGERITSWTTAPSTITQNTDTIVNYTCAHNLGSWQPAATTLNLDGYLSEVHFIDGTALDASSFGETKSGVWKPVAYTGSYGTNGFYLDFGNSGSIGADVSGNGNNFTTNNLAATDVVLDSPTNNFATLNPLHSNGTLSEGNLKATTVDNRSCTATISMPSGSWYWEMTPISNVSNCHIGICTNSFNTSTQGINTGIKAITIYGDGRYYKNGVQQGTVSSYTTGDVIGIKFNADTLSAQFLKNNTSLFTITLDALDGGASYVPATGSGGTPTVVMNFGQDSSFAGNKTAQGNTDANGYGDFYYAPPSGYLALCTANLPDPVASIDPAQDGSPQDHFNTVLWTGNSSTQSITGVGFQPDLLWGKYRNTVGSHLIYDSIRGAGYYLSSNSTAAEGGSAGTGLDSFDSDGFTLDSTAGYLNNSGLTHVGWNWKANGSGVSNTDGSITSTVSANTDAGFSIVSYTGTGSNATVGHGLSSAPDLVIVKNRDITASWLVRHSSLAANQTPLLENTVGYITTDYWQTTHPTSSVFSVSSNSEVNGSGNDIIAYCFHSVEGFSKFGSYTGNGSADGTFVYTGFKPAFVMIKEYTTTRDWHVYDSARDTYNQIERYLMPSNSLQEYSGDNQFDFLSNGFKLRSTNTGSNENGGGYIYMAFAENPFKYSTAR